MGNVEGEEVAVDLFLGSSSLLVDTLEKNSAIFIFLKLAGDEEKAFSNVSLLC